MAGRPTDPLHRLTREALEPVWTRFDIPTERIATRLGVTRQALSQKARSLGLPPRTGNQRSHQKVDADTFRRMWLAGVNTSDMAVVATQTRYVAGLDAGKAASGDPSPVTALGVYRGIKAAAGRAFGTSDLSGRSIAVQGAGSVGGYLCEHLAKDGARLFVCDIDEEAVARVSRQTGATRIKTDDIYDLEADIFSPNALGAVINRATLPRLKVKVVAGGANNQLASPDMDSALKEAGILYAPDYVINGGGIINVAAEISGDYSRDWVMGKLDVLVDTLGEVLDEALRSDLPTNLVAEQIARQRISAARDG